MRLAAFFAGWAAGLLGGLAAEAAALEADRRAVRELPFALASRDEAAHVFEPCLNAAPHISLCRWYFKIEVPHIQAAAIPEEDVLMVQAQGSTIESRGEMEEDTVSGYLKAWRYPMGRVSRGRGRRFAFGWAFAVLVVGGFILDMVEGTRDVLRAYWWLTSSSLYRLSVFKDDTVRPGVLMCGIIIMVLAGICWLVVLDKDSRSK